MFKLLSVIKSAPAQPKALNHFNFYSITMPAGLMEALQKRVYTVLLDKYHDVLIPHDLSQNHLIELDDFLLIQLDNEAHNLVIDAYELALLKRFLKVERVVVSASRLPLVPALSNAEYWKLTGELLVSTIRPTTLVGLSLFA